MYSALVQTKTSAFGSQKNLLLRNVQIPIEEDGGVNKGANNSIACQGTMVVWLRACSLQVRREKILYI